MARAKVFAFPSRLEALPLVVLEAMQMGLPVVCMKDAPGPEMIDDGADGLLADSRSTTDISAKISFVLDNPEAASRLAGNARRKVAERFSLEQCLTATERFYESCIRDRRLNPRAR
jgi:glycosyltransferase involved in cell wall biosynthesis